MSDDLWFQQLAEKTEDVGRGSTRIYADRGVDEESAPAILRSKVYSSLVTAMARSGPLLGLKEIKQGGERLCVFEHAVAILPTSTGVGSKNPCRVCHARVLGERMEHAPIFWPGCPYSEFHNG